MTPLDKIEALLNGVAMADPRAFRKLYAQTAPYFWAALLRDNAADPEERLEHGFARIWDHAAEFRPDADSPHWMAAQFGLSPNPNADPETAATPLAQSVAVLQAFESLTPQSPPPQLLNRLETRLWGARKHPIWKQVLPYVIGAMLAALLAWIGLQSGIVTPI